MPRNSWMLAGGMLGLAIGYFLWYTPYATSVKLLSADMGGFDLLPSAALGTLAGAALFLGVTGSWRHIAVNRPMITAGFFMSLVIATTTLNYTFAGVSILFMLLMMRGGVLILSPIVDTVRRRKVQPYSWIALVFSLLAVVTALSDVNNYVLSHGALLSLSVYFIGYTGRFRTMSTVAKSGDVPADRGYLAAEMAIAAVLQVLLAGAFGNVTFALGGFVVGLLYAALYVYGTLIYLDRREYTWCVPANRCASLFSGLAASFALTRLTSIPAPGPRPAHRDRIRPHGRRRAELSGPPPRTGACVGLLKSGFPRFPTGMTRVRVRPTTTGEQIGMSGYTGGTPSDNAGWWDALPGMEKQRIVREHPDRIGNLDGVPAAARDVANRARLPRERTALQRQVEDLEAKRNALIAEPKDPQRKWDDLRRWDAELEKLRAKLESIDALSAILTTPGRHLLAMDMSGDRARVAIAVGNIDTADHVAVFTPGTNSAVNGDLGGYVEDVRGIREQAEDELRKHGGEGSVAAVVWLGIEPPTTVDNPGDAAGDGLAQDGANRLVPFLNGIDASRDMNLHTTALGQHRPQRHDRVSSDCGGSSPGDAG